MKKFLAILLTCSMVLCVSACGGGSDQGASDAGSADSAGADSAGEAAGGDALLILNAVWDSYGEDERFPAAGGDFSEENSVMSAPGRYGLEDAAALDSVLGLPQNTVSLVDDAASLVHMMNANTFTCGTFHVKNADEISLVADALKENLLNRQWVCGFPDKLIILSVDGYVISAFGNEEIIDDFKAKVLSVYGSAELLCEEIIR